MKTLTRFFCLASLAAFLGSESVALAQTADTNAPSATTAKSKKKAKSATAKSAAVIGVVASVDNDAKTLTLKDHDKPYQITSKTRITKNGEPALLSDIPAGETVRVSAKADAAGVLDVSTIRVGAAPKPKKKKKAAKAESAPVETAPAIPSAPPASLTPPAPVIPPGTNTQ